jgi:hypothetical protein
MPDYRGALDWLQRQVEATGRLEEFLAARTPLLENLESSELYGATPNLDRERTHRLVPPLDRLALEVVGVSFTDIAFGRLPEARLVAGRLREVAAGLAAGVLPFPVPPPVQPLLPDLPLGALTPEQFEAVCFALVEAQADTLHAEYRGVGGDFQDGIDIVARKRDGTGTKTWAYQCKRYRSRFTRALLAEALGKLTFAADYHVVMLSRAATAGQQDLVNARANTFLWDARVLSRKLKNHPDLVEEFFGRTWRQAVAVKR